MIQAVRVDRFTPIEERPVNCWLIYEQTRDLAVQAAASAFRDAVAKR